MEWYGQTYTFCLSVVASCTYYTYTYTPHLYGFLLIHSPPTMHALPLLTSLLSLAPTILSSPAPIPDLHPRASLQQVTNFGTNPSNIKMYMYVPAKLQAKPPVVLVLHACAWTAPKFFASTKYGQLAEQHGYVLVMGSTPTDGACWDVSSQQSLTHDGGSDSTGLANMVKYALNKYGGDKSRVFVTGESSGAMMTVSLNAFYALASFREGSMGVGADADDAQQVMSAVYPDLFAAAAEFSGEPAGCFYTGTVRGWNSQCAGGQLHKSAADWAKQVHAMYPSYSGQYPKMQVYHGDVDTTLNIASFNESIKEWSGIFGYSGNAVQTINNNPGNKLTKYVYGDRLQGIWGHGFGHVVPTNETEALKWFGIIVS